MSIYPSHVCLIAIPFVKPVRMFYPSVPSLLLNKLDDLKKTPGMAPWYAMVPYGVGASQYCRVSLTELRVTWFIKKRWCPSSWCRVQLVRL